MLDIFLPMRMAQVFSEMAFRNVNTAMSLWTDGANRAVSGWSEPSGGTRDDRTVRSWYRQPDAPSRPALPFSGYGFGYPSVSPPAFPPVAQFAPWLGWVEMMGSGMNSGLGGKGGTGAGSCMMPASPAASLALWQAPMQAWMRMMSSMPGGAASPIAFGLMAFGMPRAAAWPTAEASAHAIEASRKAAEGLEQMFSTYRSDGGHAIAQIIWAGRRLH
jgi:hypothetical protein